MNKTNYNWKVYIVYVCIMIFVFISSITFGLVCFNWCVCECGHDKCCKK